MKYPKIVKKQCAILHIYIFLIWQTVQTKDIQFTNMENKTEKRSKYSHLRSWNKYIFVTIASKTTKMLLLFQL